MAENLDCFFQDDLISVAVVFGLVTTVGVLDQPDEQLAGGLVQSAHYELLVKTAAFGTVPVAGNAITVDGVAYTVNSFFKIDDGKLAKIGLSKV
jgi:hypothetical protein